MVAIFERSNLIRLFLIGMHSVVLIFTLLVVFSLTDGNVIQAFYFNGANSTYERALMITGFLIITNLLAIVLIMSQAFKKIGAISILVFCEIGILIYSCIYLSTDFSLIFGVIVITLLYEVKTRPANPLRHH